VPLDLLSRIAAAKPGAEDTLRYLDVTTNVIAGAAYTIALTEAQKLRDPQGRAVAPSVVIVAHKPAGATTPFASACVHANTSASQIQVVTAGGSGTPLRVYYA